MQATHQSDFLPAASSGGQSDSCAQFPNSNLESLQFRSMTDAMPHIVWTMRVDGSHTYFNQKWQAYTGLGPADSLAHGWAQALYPDDIAQTAQLVEQAMASGHTFEFECRLRGADDRYRWMLGRAVPQCDEAGVLSHWLGTFTDIDDLKQTTGLLEKNLSMVRIAGRVARLGGWSIDLPERTLTWSDENCLIHDVQPGYTPTLEEGLGYFMPEHRAEVIGHVQACAEQGTAYEFVLPKLTVKGRRIWVRSTGEAVRDNTGKIIRLQGAFQDITERMEQQQEILRLNNELEERVRQRTAQLANANKELESFAYAVSHDLRSPLNTVDAFSQLLLKLDAENISDKGKHYLDRIGAGVRHMGQLIEGLLTLAHLSRGAIRPEAVDLSALARRIANQVSKHEPARQLQVNIQDGLHAMGDARLLSTVFQNLLDNAWKFTSRQAQAQVDVGCQPGAHGETVFFVKDNGAGFDMAYSHKLFGTFERLHSPGEFPGTGIGLATVKRVIERHGGRVWAESKVNEGATFYFTLSVLEAMPD